MKKIFLFAAVAALAMTACSKKDGENAALDESVTPATDVEMIQESTEEIVAPTTPEETAPVNPDAVQGKPEDIPPMPEKVTDDSQPNQQPK